MPKSYVVKQGDTLGGIAQKLNVSIADLAAVNNITDPDKIKAGDVLVVPGPGASTTAPATPTPSAGSGPVQTSPAVGTTGATTPSATSTSAPAGP